MSILTQKFKPLLLAIAALSLTMAASCDLPASSDTSKIEFTGQVLDKDTNEPIEGAYALAVYKKASIGLGGTADNCYKTKGMMTGKDGKFSFPLESPKSDNPEMVYAIKADYYWYQSAVPTPAVQRAQTKETYSNRHVYLKKQDPANLEFIYGFTTCKRPESREAVEANIEFLKLRKDEAIRITGPFPWSKSYIDNIDSMIRDLQTANYAR